MEEGRGKWGEVAPACSAEPRSAGCGCRTGVGLVVAGDVVGTEVGLVVGDGVGLVVGDGVLKGPS